MRLGVLLVVLLAAACARDTVTLLPGADGTTGAVAVLSADGETAAVIDRPYQVGRVGGTDVQTAETSSDAVAETYGSLIGNLPPAPVTFRLYFEEGSTQLTLRSLPNLEKLFAEVESRTGAEVQVTGHTDSVGTVADNDRLSLDRANTVKETLIGRGLRRDLVIAVGRGERELLIATDDEVDEPRNRRVEITVR